MKFFLKFLSVTLLSVLICFSGIAPAEDSKRGGTIRVVLSQDIWTMDPIKIRTSSGEYIVHDVGIGECLYDWDDDKGVFIPRLATALPTITDRGRVYTIPIRKGVKFHDATPFNAHAAAYSIRRILNPKNKAYNFKDFGTIETITAKDDFTLKIRLKAPDNTFMAKLAARDTIAVSKKAVDQYGKEFGSKSFVGTGPFKFVEWVEGDRIVVERNPDYWKNDLPYLDKIIFQFVFDEELAHLQVQLNKVQILAEIGRNSINMLKSDRNVEVKLVPGIQHEQIYLNTKLKPFSDIRIRRALAHAIDRKAVIEKVFGGYATESIGPYHPWFWTHNPEHSQPYPYDPEKSKKLLAEAGYGPSNPLKFELMATNQDMFVEQAVMIRSFMQDIGAQVEVLPLDKSTLFDRVYVRKAFKGKPEMFQAALEDWGSSAVDPKKSADQQFSSKSVFNKGFYANPKIDDLLENVRSAETMKAQKSIYFQTEAIITQDSPTIWICNPHEAVAHRKEVMGFMPSASNRMPLMNVWLKKPE